MASQNTSSLISQIYNSRKTIIELMKEQNYNTIDYEGFSISEVSTMQINNQLDMILTKNSNNTENIDTEHLQKIYVKYYLVKSLRPVNLQEIIDDLFTVNVLKKTDTLLVVVKDDINETLINTVKHIWESENIFIILICLQRLQFNILKHMLVPHHRIIDETEKINVKNRYNLKDDEFPKISRFEPVAQVIGIRPGQVCEIERASNTAISSYYYRICF